MHSVLTKTIKNEFSVNATFKNKSKVSFINKNGKALFIDLKKIFQKRKYYTCIF